MRSAPRNTTVLVAAVEALVAGGMERDAAVRHVFGGFPVGGPAHYAHDWLNPRFGPVWRLHQGTDVFAPYGTPVRAPAAGVVSTARGGLGGLSVRVTEADGSYWYLAHLSALASGFTPGALVAVGDVVGFVGDSGNARGTPPHLHVEHHPGGGRAQDSKPLLDRFLDEAEAALASPPASQPAPDAAGPPLYAPTVPVATTRPQAPDLPGLAAPIRPTRPGDGEPVLADAHRWMAGGVRPPRVSGPQPASAEDPVVVAAGLAAVGAAIGVRRPRPRAG